MQNKSEAIFVYKSFFYIIRAISGKKNAYILKYILQIGPIIIQWKELKEAQDQFVCNVLPTDRFIVKIFFEKFDILLQKRLVYSFCHFQMLFLLYFNFFLVKKC